MKTKKGWLRTLDSIPQAAIEKFWDNVLVCEKYECWPWMGRFLPSQPASGYVKHGHYKSPNYFQGYVHRISWIIHKGEIPEGLLVFRTCSDEISCCVNPDHMKVGTCADQGRARKAVGRYKPPTKYSKQLVREIRLRAIDDNGKKRTLESLGKEFNVPFAYVGAILSGTIRAKAGGPIVTMPGKNRSMSRKKKEIHKFSWIPKDKVALIKNLLSLGFEQREIAELVGCGQGSVSRIKLGQNRFEERFETS